MPKRKKRTADVVFVSSTEPEPEEGEPRRSKRCGVGLEALPPHVSPDPDEGKLNCPSCQCGKNVGELGCKLLICINYPAHGSAGFYFCRHCRSELDPPPNAPPCKCLGKITRAHVQHEKKRGAGTKHRPVDVERYRVCEKVPLEQWLPSDKLASTVAAFKAAKVEDVDQDAKSSSATATATATATVADTERENASTPSDGVDQHMDSASEYVPTDDEEQQASSGVKLGLASFSSSSSSLSSSSSSSLSSSLAGRTDTTLESSAASSNDDEALPDTVWSNPKLSDVAAGKASAYTPAISSSIQVKTEPAAAAGASSSSPTVPAAGEKTTMSARVAQQGASSSQDHSSQAIDIESDTDNDGLPPPPPLPGGVVGIGDAAGALEADQQASARPADSTSSSRGQDDKSSGPSNVEKRAAAVPTAKPAASKPKSKGRPKKLSKNDQKWMGRFEELKLYKDVHGDCNVPRKNQLGNWVTTQRQQYRLRKEGKKSQVTDKRIEMLEIIGFEWSMGDPWEVRYNELKEYKGKHGNCNVLQRWNKNPQLASWVHYQRTQYRLLNESKKSQMTKNRIQMLESVGFEWSLQGSLSWEERYEELKQYKGEHGDCNVPNIFKENQQLASWVSEQRKQYRLLKEGKKSRMTDERIDTLESIGFEWTVGSKGCTKDDKVWEVRYEELKQYKSERGHCKVPTGWNKNPQLASWVSTQRYQYRLLKEGNYSSMTKERLDALKNIGFEWSVIEPVSWQVRYEELKQYKRVHGDCNVPKGWNKNPRLATWVQAQRKQYRLLKEGKKSSITDERLDALKSIGFEWSLKVPNAWELRYKQLKQYKKDHGNCNVPAGWNKNPQLASWIKTQRYQYRLLKEGKKSSITDERIQLLEGISFEWSILRDPWEVRYEELKQYKSERGHCKVPKGWNKNPQLATWVQRQRTKYRLLKEGKKSSITDERIRLLAGIGFE